LRRRLEPWTPYQAGPEAPWNRRRVVHLHRRAGFAASWPEIERDLKDGPDLSVARLLEANVRGGPKEDDFSSISRALADAAISAGDSDRLKAWWVHRMLCGPDPLGERLTLLWHDHFATSNQKVGDLSAMLRQNELFRTLARAPFGKLLNAVARDPAMLVWLDAPANRKGHPNENLAREIMELFSLGIGNYTEADVKEAARALTGWTVVDGAFHEASDQHDSGQKTLFGRKGAWTGADLVKFLVAMPATSLRLARRLCGLFFGEPQVEEAAIQALALGLRAHELDIGWGVSTILKSREFFDANNIGTRVLSPVEYIAGSTVALGLAESPPSTLVLADWMARLGQDLFYPPNVGGWPGGRSYLSSGSLIGRTKFAFALCAGKPVGLAAPIDGSAMAKQQGRQRDWAGVIDAASALLLASGPDPAWREAILKSCKGNPKGKALEQAIALVLASPAAQLG
jgi:uncharacterized protein (DUF1800 family)